MPSNRSAFRTKISSCRPRRSASGRPFKRPSRRHRRSVLQNFNYHRPSSPDEAVQLLQGKEEAKFLGGGMSLVPVMKLDLAQPSDLVSLSG
ncbi:MAG: FAD binding domain-containing protein, partial [Myxococcota bacterium]